MTNKEKLMHMTIAEIKDTYDVVMMDTSHFCDLIACEKCPGNNHYHCKDVLAKWLDAEAEDMKMTEGDRIRRMTDHDERFTEQFSKGLYQVISDNPDIFKPEEIEKEHDICPICGYPIPSCQCMYDHGIDRSKRMEVVFSHLHLLTPEQQKHVVRLQSEMNISYEDSERDHIYWELMGKNKVYINNDENAEKWRHFELTT